MADDQLTTCKFPSLAASDFFEKAVCCHYRHLDRRNFDEKAVECHYYRRLDTFKFDEKITTVDCRHYRSTDTLSVMKKWAAAVRTNFVVFE